MRLRLIRYLTIPKIQETLRFPPAISRGTEDHLYFSKARITSATGERKDASNGVAAKIFKHYLLVRIMNFIILFLVHNTIIYWSVHSSLLNSPTKVELIPGSTLPFNWRLIMIYLSHVPLEMTILRWIATSSTKARPLAPSWGSSPWFWLLTLRHNASLGQARKTTQLVIAPRLGAHPKFSKFNWSFIGNTFGKQWWMDATPMCQEPWGLWKQWISCWTRCSPVELHMFCEML